MLSSGMLCSLRATQLGHPASPMATAAMGAWQALNALYDGANARSTLRHWHSPRQVSSTKPSTREPLLPSTRIAVGVSEPFLVVLNPHQGRTLWKGRKLVRASADAASSPAVPGKDPEIARTSWLQKLARARAAAPPASDIFWPSAGAFVAMAGFGYLDDLLAARGLKFTMASFGAVSALLFTAPAAPASQKYAVFVAHLACALLGVAALAAFGPGFLSRGVAVAGSIAFMQLTGSFHPPAAAIPLIFIDNPKFHSLTWWYILFPGVVGCFLLFLLQEGVLYLKEKWKFG